MDTFQIDSIPPIICKAGEIRTFQIVPVNPDVVLTCELISEISDALKDSWRWEQNEQTFCFSPPALVNGQFALKISSSEIDSKACQFITCCSLIELMPETDKITSSGIELQADALKYLTYAQILKPSAQFFNGQMRPTREISVVGNVLEISESANNDIYSRLTSIDDVEVLSIFANVLTIASPLALPMTKVTLRCRNLHFKNDGCIDTTPKPIIGTPPRQDGHEGHAGGDISVFAVTIDNPSDEARFKCGGGRGGDAGEGENGENKPEIPYTNKPFKNSAGGSDPVLPDTVYAATSDWSKAIFPLPFLGPPAPRPEDGGPAIPPGTPGVGGPAGILTSNINLESKSYILKGGTSGKKANDCSGGNPGSPNPYFYATAKFGPALMGWYDVKRLAQPLAVRGKDAIAPDAKMPKGPDTEFVLSTERNPWLHQSWLSALCRFAKDCFQAGSYSQLREALKLYFEQILPNIDFSQNGDLLRIDTELQQIRMKLNSGLDFFGNSHGWYPRLSLQIGLGAYDQQIESAISTIFTTNWMHKRLEQFELNRERLFKSAALLKSNIQQLESELLELENRVSPLMLSLNDLKNETASIQFKLQSLDDQLRDEAKTSQTPEEPSCARTSLRVIGTVATMIPVYQPALAAAGTGLVVLSKLGEEPMLDTLQQLTSIAEAKPNDDLASNITNFRSAVTTCSPGNKASITNLATCSKALLSQTQSTLEQINTIIQSKQGSNEELQQAIAALRARSPQYRKLTDKAFELSQRNRDLAHELSTLIASITTIASNLTLNFETQATLSQTISTIPIVDISNAGENLKNMQDNAEARLLHYRYWMRKSFEYWRLVPCNSSPLPTDLLNEIILLSQDTENIETIDLQKYKSIFHEETREIVKSIFEDFNSGKFNNESDFYYELTKPEIDTLNQDGALELNLSKVFFILRDQDNRRLLTVSIDPDDMRGDTLPGNGSGLIDLQILHSGLSLVNSGLTYCIFSTSPVSPEPFVWRFTLICSNPPKFTKSKPSSADVNLLRSMLGTVSSPDDNVFDTKNLSLFSAPGANTKLKLKMEATDAELKYLKLKFSYSYKQTSDKQISVNIESFDDFKTFISVSQTDLRQRKDGFGSIFRIYSKDDNEIKLSVPSSVGLKVFDRWTSEKKTISESPELSIKVDEDYHLQYHYK